MDIPTQLQTSLSTTTHPLPSLPWLRALCTPRTPTSPLPPLASLLATARTRLLSSDLTAPGLLDARWAATHALPPQLAASQAGTRESRLAVDVVVQVLDVEDVSRSRWEQAEGLEALARGEGLRGREVVRLPVGDGGGGGGGAEGEDGEGDGEGVGVGGGQEGGPQ
ncbi:predicted protein [Chaetomium globosum CBS 148.51]|uniref:Uncharacterized protein n=1 Tax=Chaetomium globosum (strain ATCC 6205 / CBS 148.51 / DSM 1962 / NBRC 6347 / NRRL 1970) TaxID=306901 RepID=Q2GQR9_CHAGB|nr:uncharacterized protein CHGG_09685 [Chaetomium globosum CBS 148.51]EAQ83281.1 predicted protein [Chaetomium globosum CBS 148.51]